MIEKFNDSKLLRVFIEESDHFKGKPLYEYILFKAKELKVGGATILKAVEGYGSDFRVHSSKLLEISEDLPIIIEIVDSEEKIDELLQAIEPALKEALITVEDIKAYKIKKI